MATAKWDGTRWRVRVTQGGKVRSYQSTTPGRKGKLEAEEKARKGERLSADVVLSVAWDRYLEEVKHLTGPENYTNIESIGRIYILPVLGGQKLSQILLADYQELIWKAKKQNGEPLSKKTLSNIRGALVNFSRFCVRSSLMPSNLSELKIPTLAPKKGKVILQPDEARRLFSEFNDDWYINLWRFLLATGCRPGEALGLKWSDIHDGVISIQRAYNYRGRMTEGKNENARRSFAINSILDKILKDQEAKTWRIRTEFIFCNHAGQPAKQTATKNSWSQIAKALGTSASPYSLRHTFVSFMAQTLPQQALKDLIGHSVNMDTYGVYKKVVNGEQKRTSEAVNIQLLQYLE